MNCEKVDAIRIDEWKKLGYTLIQIPRCNLVYPEISSHVDIFCCKIKENLIIEKSIYNDLFYEIIQSNKENFSKLLSGENSVGSNYPHDILYNVCVVGDFVIHNFKYKAYNTKELATPLA